MGRKSVITIHEYCEEPTFMDNELCSILVYKYPDRADVIVKRFMAYVGKPLRWESVSKMNLTIFKDRCKCDMSPNATATTCAWLSSAISIYAQDNGLPYRDLCEALTFRREQGTFTFVTEDDISKIIDYYRMCKNRYKRAVAANAILEFYTGARKSDIDDMTLSNIENVSYIDKRDLKERSVDMITYTSHKTKVKSSIPVKPIVAEILSDTLIAGVDVQNQTMNTLIKTIVEEAGIDRCVHERRAGSEYDRPIHQCVTSHTFRRSFATNLDRIGTPIETTSRMMGHTNTQQTRRYICGDTLTLSEETINFFK